MKVTDSSVFFASPGPGKAARAHAVYTRALGVEKLRLRSYMTRADTRDWFERSFSKDTTLSSFLVEADRETKEHLVHLSRLHTRGQTDWTSDVVLHRVEV